MKPDTKKWYLLAYDIRNMKRLQRTHYFIKKKGSGLQRSVFLVRTGKADLAELINGIRERVNDREDDVRIYPVRHPGVLWAAGQQAEKINSLYAPTPEKKSTGLRARIRQLFSRRNK